MVMVIELVFGQAPFVVQESVYTPKEQVAKLIVPDVGLSDKPEGVDEKVPPGKPEIVGIGFVPDRQYVADVQVNEALSRAFMVNVVVAIAARHVPLAGMVLITVQVPGALDDKSI